MQTRESQIALVIVLIMIAIVTLIGSSYALFTKTLVGTKKVTVQTGTLNATFEEGNAIKLENTVPMSDTVGLQTTPYTFTIKNTGNIKDYYTVYNEEDTSTTTLDTSLLKYKLTGSNGYDSGIKTIADLGSGKIVLTSSTLDVGQSVTYTLYIWLSSEATNNEQGKMYQSKILVQNTSNLVKYYAFGNPTEADKTNFQDVISENGYSIFNQLYGTQKSVCIYKNNILDCFKNNSYNEESSHIKSVFEASVCTIKNADTGNEYINCNDGTFSCSVYSKGSMNCYNFSQGIGCYVNSTGYAYCGNSSGDIESWGW
ncbi:MAG: hypothetical protein PUB03_05750 [bacterium]|nr:hypothetical protein [bacterium]